jgi:PAS domain S-box-containing protein
MADARIDAAWLAPRILEATGDAVLFGDREGRIRYWNGGAERTFGWAASEALGQSMDLIIPERLRGRHWEGWDRVMETGVTRYGTELLAVPAARKDGAPLSIEFTIQLVRGDGGEILGAAAIVRDVTARWTRERETRRKVQELEARVKELEAKAAPPG